MRGAVSPREQVARLGSCSHQWGYPPHTRGSFRFTTKGTKGVPGALPLDPAGGHYHPPSDASHRSPQKGDGGTNLAGFATLRWCGQLATPSPLAFERRYFFAFNPWRGSTAGRCGCIFACNFLGDSSAEGSADLHPPQLSPWRVLLGGAACRRGDNVPPSGGPGAPPWRIFGDFLFARKSPGCRAERLHQEAQELPAPQKLPGRGAEPPPNLRGHAAALPTHGSGIKFSPPS